MRIISDEFLILTFSMKVFRYSEIGSHDENEDAIAAVAHITDSSTMICALADGQGGQRGAAVAANHSISSCLIKAQSYSPRELLNPFTWETIGEFVDKNVAEEVEAGFTTFIGLCVAPQYIVGASCGDSAVVLTINEKVFILSERQYKNPPVGSGSARFTSFSSALYEKWKVLLISDGVWKFTGWDSAIRIIQTENGKDVISKLRENVISKTSELFDDFSLILIES